MKEVSDWKKILRQNFTDWKKLSDFLELNEEQRRHILPNSELCLNLPIRLAKKIQKGTLDDPILTQFLPTVAEAVTREGFFSDPVGDLSSRRASKMLQKYQERVLLLCSNACAMHCRFCFRRHFDYTSDDKTFDDEIALIDEDPTLCEVILSGGDPLCLSNAQLESLLHQISAISHVRRIRFHTRFPIGIPERIDEPFVRMLGSLPQQVYFVIHCNHPRELDREIFDRLSALQSVGVIVLHQAVLLRGVNDRVETLYELYKTLVDHGILPYYLHQLDRVQGAARFEVPENEGIRLIEELRVLLPGYAVPKYVREIAGEASKTPIV